MRSNRMTNITNIIRFVFVAHVEKGIQNSNEVSNEFESGFKSSD